MTDVRDGSRTEAWLDRDGAALAGVLPRYYDVVAVSGEGSWLVDVEGRRYLDLGAGIAVNSTGHCHPHVVDAIAEQARTLIHTSVVVHHPRNIELAERIGGLCPFIDRPQVFFCNSGAEAVDGAVKLARRVTGRPGILAFKRAFHGRTLAATTLTTAKGRYREGYEPLLPSVYHAPYCLPHEHATPDAAVDAALAALDDVLAIEAPPSSLAAVIVEPVLGEGGYVPPPRAWLEGLRQRCDRHGILLIFDEVQCGAGRTGRPFAAETYGVRPDVLLFAKGIASGMPLGGIVASEALMSQWPTGAHGSTFGGNPVACAAALATLDVFDRENVYTRVRSLGSATVDRLRAEIGGLPPVRDIRGVGLMIGIELADAATAQAVCARCLDAGVIVLSCGPGENVLRLAPPLTISDADLTTGLDTLIAALR
ncbi:MAG TPA: aminotransferase class III-fold pyridoxal phosphate-dependent enzyme [Acidimicrobiales bacterium]|jgi:4-aminobutyrate aminotransferase|nr:aminotransferase class III-fold pyridoxal phosphate-dependent enzyme [Acidimicrobiales bacterium]